MKIETMINEAVAGHVVVEPEYGWRAGIFRKPEHLVLGKTVLDEKGEERVSPCHAPTEKVGAQPAAMFTRDAELFQGRCRKGRTAILGVNQTS